MSIFPSRIPSSRFRHLLRPQKAYVSAILRHVSINSGSTPTSLLHHTSIDAALAPSIRRRRYQACSGRARFSTTSYASFRAYTINNDANPTTSAAEPTTAAPEASVEPPDYLSEGELEVFSKLKRELEPTKLEVQDISGGCGSMYALDIVSSKFKGKNVIQQHKLVNSILKDELKSWHGVQLKTKAG